MGGACVGIAHGRRFGGSVCGDEFCFHVGWGGSHRGIARTRVRFPGIVGDVWRGVACCRDAQRLNMSSMGSLSNEDHARLQMATKQLTDYNARRAQQQAASAASGVPVLGGLANSNGLPMLSTSTSGGMLVGLNRGLSRAGLAGMGSPVVSSMGTGGLSGRLPPSGNLAASNVSRRIAGLVNMARVRNFPQHVFGLAGVW